MTIMGKSNPLGGGICAYPPGTTLFDGYDGASEIIDLKKGVYYIRGQGAGGAGGNNGYSANGGGGASSAGFMGYISILSNFDNCTVYTGKAATKTATAGEATSIGKLMSLGGGGGGGSGSGVPGVAGIFQFDFDESCIGKAKILSYTVKSDGNTVEKVGSAYAPGANSVLTNDGGGAAGSGVANRHATKPGAGGAGGIQWDSTGGFGKYGELTIQYIKPR